jgi:hypothetical protein
MSNHMNDPFYTAIIFQIESRIIAKHRDAQSKNLQLTDSQVRSILNKVRKTSGGAKTQLPTGSEREQILGSLHGELMQVWAELSVESADGQIEDLPLRDWVLALKTVEDSIQTHSSGPGSYSYLVFLEGFMDWANSSVHDAK